MNLKFCALDIMGYTKYELSIFTTVLHYASEKSFHHCVRKSYDYFQGLPNKIIEKEESFSMSVNSAGYWICSSDDM